MGSALTYLRAAAEILEMPSGPSADAKATALHSIEAAADILRQELEEHQGMPKRELHPQTVRDMLAPSQRVPDDRYRDQPRSALRRMQAPAHRYSASELKRMPTLHQGHYDNLKLDTGTQRVWLSRMTVADGAEADNMVRIEELRDGSWRKVEEYPG